MVSSHAAAEVVLLLFTHPPCSCTPDPPRPVPLSDAVAHAAEFLTDATKRTLRIVLVGTALS